MASAYYVTQINWPACDIITVAQCFDVFACTLLHRELQDYSLGQIAFTVFKRYLLSHSCFAMQTHC